MVVVPKGKRSILGRNALAGLGVNINFSESIGQINEISKGDIGKKFKEVFSDKLGELKGFVHRVRLKEVIKPVQHRVRRLPVGIRETVRRELEELQIKGVIEPVEASEFVSRMVVAAKKDGRARICVDLRQVNGNIVVDAFPLSHVEDLFLELKGARYFSKLDALSAYHQVELAEESRDLTAFITPWGFFRYKRYLFKDKR